MHKTPPHFYWCVCGGGGGGGGVTVTRTKAVPHAENLDLSRTKLSSVAIHASQTAEKNLSELCLHACMVLDGFAKFVLATILSLKLGRGEGGASKHVC